VLSLSGSGSGTVTLFGQRARFRRVGFKNCAMLSNPPICSGIAFTNDTPSRGRFDVVELRRFRTRGLLWVKDGSGSLV
jgi:hypothetical protein